MSMDAKNVNQFILFRYNLFLVQNGGRIITLKAIDGTDENTFDEPKKIYPHEASFDDYGNDFSFVFAPYSYTVLRIPFE